MSRPNTKDYLNIFLNDIPLLDVRADVEFVKGAFPSSQNIPLLNDEQRCLVGTCYKEKGQDAAIDLGYELATDEIKESRLATWREYVAKYPTGYLHCFRGGLRSRISQEWLAESGIEYPIVQGGYKAMRTFLLEELQKNIRERTFVMIGGRTGSGKTHVLKNLSNHVDLEGIAKHRGSTFGATIQPQPAQIDFENEISIEILKQIHAHKSPIFIEHEGSRIGHIHLPLELHTAMVNRNPLVILETKTEERIAVCIQDYITEPYRDFQEAYGELAHEKYSETILGNLFQIQRRLGGDRYIVIKEQFTAALEKLKLGDSSGFEEPILSLLRDYYDPMYDYQLAKQKGKILFKGDKKSITQWANTYQG